ncbi:Arylsulphatase [Hortaea werneckii]|nr:Arylsulphatase [Hortaea werneckii]
MSLGQLACLYLGALWLVLMPAWTAEHKQQHPLIPADVPKSTEKQPNMIFILTDDQDLHMDSLSYMPYLQEHLVKKGTSYGRHYCTVALCCPSRASLLTGKAAHNVNVTDVNPPYGGYPKFVSQGFNSAYLPLWLQEAGYNTYYTGKLFNAHSIDNYDSPFAAGWNGSDFLLDPFTYEYLNATMQRNRDDPISYEGQYSADVVASKAYGFLDEAIEAKRKESRPFWLGIAPMAPHSNNHHNERSIDGNFTEKSVTMSPPVSAARHKNLFQDVKVPRTPHFNPDHPNGVSWIGQLPQQNETNVDYNDEWYRSRLRALQPVDEMIDEVFRKLEEAGITDETYVFFSTDNGYHIGQHRLQPGKQCAYEEDINVPFIVRGPGVASGHTADVVSTHTDLAPTFLHLAGVEDRTMEKYKFDGQAMPLMASSEYLNSDHKRSGQRTEHVNVEMWGIIMSEGKHGQVLHPIHTYKALRLVGEDYNLLYTVWCSNEHELYDLNKDPWEMDNLYTQDDDRILSFTNTNKSSPYSSPTSSQDHESISQDWFPQAFTEANEDGGYAKRSNPSRKNVTVPLPRLISRLDTLLIVLKTCKGRQCTHPWKVLHPEGDVQDLHDALNSDFDDFYENEQQRLYFEKCEKGYIAESEGPDGPKVWGDGGVGFMWDEMAV